MWEEKERKEGRERKKERRDEQERKKERQFPVFFAPATPVCAFVCV